MPVQVTTFEKYEYYFPCNLQQSDDLKRRATAIPEIKQMTENTAMISPFRNPLNTAINKQSQRKQIYKHIMKSITLLQQQILFYHQPFLQVFWLLYPSLSHISR